MPFEAASPSRAVYYPNAGTEILEILPDGYVLLERAVHGQTWDELPLALTPPSPPNTRSQQAAIVEWAERVVGSAPDFPRMPRPTSCAGSRRARARAGRSRMPQTTRSTRSSRPCATSTTATSPCRGHRARARPTPGRE
ncbi:hypothetical protein [Microbacterium sp. NIBRBAC000506063]|uniref:hypothetical protein n=1 Tax=Microbacterium sp. NIBRBAC000506063 TaxID=2734618 RepID=UPI00397EC857